MQLAYWIFTYREDFKCFLEEKFILEELNNED